MNTLAPMYSANRVTAYNPIEFDGLRILELLANPSRQGFIPLDIERFRTKADPMRTLLTEPNVKRLKA